MKPRFLVALLATIAAAGCGGGSSSTPTAPGSPAPPAPPAVVATGDNWSFRLDGFTGAPAHTISPGNLTIVPTYGSTSPLVGLEGAFNADAGSVSAVLQPFGRCFDWDTNRVRFTGTRSGNTVELQSQANGGQVVRITVTLSPDGSAAQGTYTISGGCSGSIAGSFSGRRVNLTGVWSGVLGGVPTVLDMQMAATPDADANFAVSGSARFSGSSCFADATITRRGRGRIIFPDVAGAQHRMELIAEVWEDLSAMEVTFGLTQGVCPELASGKGRLTRQP
jgi:hypothetical protein